MNNDNREQRIEHARAYMKKTLQQDIILAIGVSIIAVLAIIALIVNYRRSFPDDSTIVWIILAFCIGLLWISFDTIPKHIKRLKDVEGHLEEIERIEASAKKQPQKSQTTTHKTYTESRPIWYYTYGEHGWRKTIPHSEYRKYHIKPEDYETEYEYEDALRKAKKHYDKLHD